LFYSPKKQQQEQDAIKVILHVAANCTPETTERVEFD